jgi:EmrB/QacA subfamily drug resistance transporter
VPGGPATRPAVPAGRGAVLAGVVLSMAMVAIDTTIVSTAVPAIVRDIGGFQQFPWMFSAFLLAQAAAIPIYGKLADVRGRRPTFLLGLVTFLGGSALCGLAWSMPALILFRVVQGVGAGCVLPLSFITMADLYSIAERARVQALLAGVWAAGLVAGPTLGGVFSQYLSWQWIFLVNLPVGAVAVWLFARHFHETVARLPHRFDILGSLLLTTGSSLLIVALLEGGTAWGWSSPQSLLAVGLGAMLLAAFVVAERRAVEPIMPGWLFLQRVLVGGNVASILIGGLMLGLGSYVPLYLQGVLGVSAVHSGWAMAVITIGLPLSGSVVGRAYLRLGLRNTALVGGAVALVGTFGMVLLGVGSTLLSAVAAGFLISIGLGWCASPTIIAVQSSVAWARRGVVTATNMYARALGAAVAGAVSGAVINAVMVNRLGPLGLQPRDVVAGGDGRTGPGTAADAVVRAALFGGIHLVFVLFVAVAVALLAALALIPGGRISSPEAAPDGAAVAG